MFVDVPMDICVVTSDRHADILLGWRDKKYNELAANMARFGPGCTVEASQLVCGPSSLLGALGAINLGYLGTYLAAYVACKIPNRM